LEIRTILGDGVTNELLLELPGQVELDPAGR
jgi:hypothetical protein